MKKIQNRKDGFTIVELVIVIAVIAIMAAVLIPTFASLIIRANLSADQVAVKNMNTALSSYAVDHNEFTGRTDIYKALQDAGFATDGLKPVSADCKFIYISELNKMVLVNKDGDVLYPQDKDIQNYGEINIDLCYDMTTSLPAASLEKMDELSVKANWLNDQKKDLTLDTGIKFEVDSDIIEDTGEWDKWMVDFEISFNKDVPEALNTAGNVTNGLKDNGVGFLLMGYRGDTWGWNPIVLSSATKDTPVRVMKDLFFKDSNMAGWHDFVSNYQSVKNDVGSFECGIISVWSLDNNGNINTSAMTEAQKEFLDGLTVTLQLKMYKTVYENTKINETTSQDTITETGESYLISTYTYTWNID